MVCLNVGFFNALFAPSLDTPFGAEERQEQKAIEW